MKKGKYINNPGKIIYFKSKTLIPEKELFMAKKEHINYRIVKYRVERLENNEYEVIILMEEII
ncbi:hypothetical protein [Streptobacillus moniliformis]|uniref:hypothetical protein n=1 Tax=Streptobacillus moniliformis TaxID=34105 RepID=UPI0007E3AE51|nr:hypothetical protein [Streptobacillus moniliformis]